MRKRGAAMQRDVLNGQQKFPERLGHIRILAPRGKQKVNRENHKVRWHDPQDAARVESRQIQMLATRDLRQELAANQIAAENKKEIDADPTPSMDATRQRETHDASVIRSEEHTSELQSLTNLVCRLLLEKKKKSTTGGLNRSR